jgi:tetratricopeptide (TPR) repeat protein
MKISKGMLILVIVLLGTVLASVPAQAISPYDDVLVGQAAKNLQEENYDEALAALTEAWQKGTHTAEKAFLLAQTYRLMLNYPKAKEYLEEALRLKPNLFQARLMLADTLVALDKPKEALPILKALEPTGYEPGQVAYLRGLAEAKEQRYKVALDYFRKAETDPKVAQDAKFQESLALAALNRIKEARASMKEAISLNPQTQTGEFAQRYMGILSKRWQEVKPFRATVAASFDYDSNVTLQPGGAGTAAQISGKGDAVFTQTATFEYNFLANQPFSVLTQYSYFQNFHPVISSYDVMSHYFGVIPTYSYKSGRVWLPMSFNYVDLQADKYYTGYLVNPTWLHLLNEHFGVELGGRFNRKYYWNQIYFPQDDRSAKNIGASLGGYYFFKQQKGFVQIRASYEHDNATGNNWDCSYYRVFLAALYPFTDKFKGLVFVDLLYQPFDNPFYNGTTFEDNRYDHVLVTGLTLTYDLPKGFEVNLHYFFTRDKSTVGLYNYSRHLVGGQIAYRY